MTKQKGQTGQAEQTEQRKKAKGAGRGSKSGAAGTAPQAVAEAATKISVSADAAKQAKGPAAKTVKTRAVKSSQPAKTLAPAKEKPSKKVAIAKKSPKPVSVKKSASKQAAGQAPEQPAEKQPKAAKILDSEVAYEGPLFRVVRDHLIEPDGTESRRDVIRHNGSVVILAADAGKKSGKRKKDPWIVIERQYRHAAGQFLWELPAGKLELGEEPLEGAKRELAEETGYSAKKWSPLVEYYASPGFLGEAMKVFLAEGLVAGEAHPEEDEHIDFRLVKLSEVLAMVDEGKIIDGKTLTSVLLYARLKGIKSRSKSK